MFLHKNKSIWDSSIKLIGLWIIITGIYLALNKTALHILKYRKSLWILVLIMILTMGIAIVVLIYTLKEQRDYSKVKFNLVHRGLIVISGVIATFILRMIFGIPMRIFNINPVSKNQQILNASFYGSKCGIIYAILIGCIAAPIIEEFLFRFLIIGPNPRGHQLISKSIYWIRIIIGIFIFAFMHMIPQLKYVTSISALGMLFLQLLPYLAMSIAFTYVYVHTQDYKASVATHMINNIIATLANF